MKTVFYSSIFLALTLISSANLQAQQIDDNPKNILQLQPIILTAEALKAEDGENFGDFQVIICGKKIGDITDTAQMNDFIEKAKKAGVQIVACGFSLNKFKVDKTEVPKEIKTVENGILHNFQLQKKGYKSLSL